VAPTRFFTEGGATTAAFVNDPDSPLASLPMTSLAISFPEVAHVFHLPFQAMISPPRLRTHLFRGRIPYWAVSVSDIVHAVDSSKHGSSDLDQRDETGGGPYGRLEIWGLTAWYLSLLLKALEIYR